MIKTGKLLKDNKGSALIMVFAVVLLLVSFGTITLLAGVSNAQMGARYRNWSKEYYELDQLTENYVKQMDSYLNNAENYARAYFANKAYEDPTPDETKIPLFNELPFDLHDLIHNHWNTSVMTLDQNQYISNLKDFYDQGFKKLYYYYASRILDNWAGSLGKNNVLITVTNNGPASFSSWESIPDSDKNGDGTYYLSVGIIVKKSDSSKIESYKSVNAQLNVQLPQYQTITQTRKVPIKTNPIWTNAITAAGSIFFSDAPTDSSQQVKIYGDLFSADKTAQTDKGATAQMDDYLAESQNNGIISNGAYVDVYGNIYSRGDLHVAQNNGRIVVNSYDTGTKVDLKKSAYSDSSLYVNTLGSDIDDKIIEYKKDTADHIAFIYDDNNNAGNNGGNVYCNSISVESCDKGSIEINGNVMMRDDVENNGTNSNITIKKNLIGISSESDIYDNPNASSSVTNNEPESSNIVINGNLIVPGQIYLTFDGGNFYQTGISIGSWGKNNEILNNTLTQKLSEKDQFTEFTRGEDHFKLFTGTLQEKIDHITNYFKQTSPPLEAPISVDTSVSVINKVKGYVLGTVIAKTDTPNSANVVQVTDYLQNQHAFGILKGNNTLRSILNAKTVGLGNDVYKDANKSVLTNNFNAYVKKSELTESTNGITYLKAYAPPLTLNDKTNYIVYAEGNSTLTLNGTSSGIIYVAGDLTIDGGNNEFDGTIICEGNVTINGHPTIRYSEAEIIKCFLANDSLGAFFKPGESGKETFVDEASIDGIYKSTTVMKRYTITQWKEEQGIGK